MPTATQPPSLPLAWYLNEAHEQRELIQRAEAELIATCMAKQGFDFVAPEYRPDLDFLGKRYGVPPDIAESIGFQSLDALDSDAGTAELPQESPAPGPEFDFALIGAVDEARDVELGQTGVTVTLVGGCSGQARREIFGSDDDAIRFAELDQLVQRIDLDAYTAALISEPVTESLRRWQSCMADRGFDVASRDELLSRDWPEPRPGHEERRTAVGDAKCLDIAGYELTLQRAEAEQQRSLLDHSPGIVDSFRTLRSRVLDRARSVTES